MRDGNVFKAASGLCGGIGQMHDVCGALTGAAMILSSKYGRGLEEIENTDKMKDAHLYVGKLYKWFEKEFSSVKCRDIRVRHMGVYYDSKIPWQAELAKEAGFPEHCQDLVGKTTAKTTELLWDAEEDKKKKE
jgi:C_GCAxxG_C_C family probable redox protein